MLLTALSPRWTFSHMAALIAAEQLKSSLGDISIKFEPRNIDVLEDVAFRKGLGVVAYRNSTKGAGLVTQVVKDYWFEQNNGARIFAIGEIKLLVEHHVFVRSHVKSARQVDTLITHLHAHLQTRKKTHALGLRGRRINATSTAEAARMVANDSSLRNAAAIASKKAGEFYGLHLLFPNVEDEPGNTTRFHILNAEPVGPTGNDKTVLIFQTNNDRHAVHRVRNVIGGEGRDPPYIRPITSDESPLVAFFCEFSGHRDTDEGRETLNALRCEGNIAAFIGSFPKP